MKGRQKLSVYFLVGLASFAGGMVDFSPRGIIGNHSLERAVESASNALIRTSGIFDFSPNSFVLDSGSSNYSDPSKTRSQAAVDSVLDADVDCYIKTGKGLYAGRRFLETTGSESSSFSSVDCVFAPQLIINSEFSPEDAKKIMENSTDADGNFSAPFMIRHLIEKEGWEAYGYYDTKLQELSDDKKIISDRNISVKKDGLGFFYRAGNATFPLADFFQIRQADSLLKQLTLERGYGLGFQRDGTHCFALVHDGMFEVHLNSYPWGYSLDEKINFRPLDFHRGRYHSRSSVAVFAFPPKKD